MSDAPGSQEPLVCPRCLPLERSLAEREEALRVLSIELEERAVEVAGLQFQLRRAGQAEVALRNQLKQVIDEDTDQDVVIRTLCDAWKRLLGHPRAKTPKTGKRWKVAKAALRHHTPEECMEAIHGLSLVPYVGARGRASEGDEKQRYDDLEHCLRDEVTVDRFIGYYRRARNAAIENRQGMWDLFDRVSAQRWELERLLLGAALADEQGTDLEAGMEAFDRIDSEVKETVAAERDAGAKVIQFPKGAAA